VHGFSLKTRLLLAPVLGLLLVILLAAAFYWQTESQNQTLTRIAYQDLRLLDRYTDLFTELSRQHMRLYELLYDAGRKVDEGQIYDRGVEILDAISNLTDEMVRLSGEVSPSRGLHGFSKQTSEELVTRLEAYRNAAISSVEMTSVGLQYAADYLTQANQHFTFMHGEFAERLDESRAAIRSSVRERVESDRQHTLMLVLGGSLIASILSLFGLLLSFRLSHNLQLQIATLNDLSESYLNMEVQPAYVTNDEVSRMGHAIEVFRNALQRIRQQERSLEDKNRHLRDEIEARNRIEQALREAKEELEARVIERTGSLIEANETLQDEIDQRIQAQQRLHIYKQVIDNTNEAVVITDPETRIIEVNPAYEKMLGFSRDELLGRLLRNMVRTGKHDDDFYQRMWQNIDRHGHWSGEIFDRHKNGELIPFWMSVNAIRDETGNVSKYIGLSRDIRELKQAERQLEQMAYFDPLTGLANRTLFEQRLIEALNNARIDGCRLALLYIDLDRFKYVNDTYGHSIGDELLMQVSVRLKNALRDNDTVARMGGDEFTIILSRVKAKSDAMHVAAKIVAAISRPITISGVDIKIGTSIGLAFFPEQGENIETLKKHADIAMYQAKEAGRNRYQVFDPALQHRDAEYRAMVKAVDHACSHGEFALYYQPIVEIASRRLVGVEALVRWPLSDGGCRSPSEFIPVAEEAGLIGRIDAWVLETACRSALPWIRRLQGSFTINVNLSPSLFQEPGTPVLIERILRKTGLFAANLCLEITETAVISDPEIARKTLLAITNMGISVALDDFGTGFSSLTHLTRFPLRKIKIDRSFIASTLVDGATEAVVRSMVDLAKNMDISVVAEGVEEPSQHEFLQELDCDFGQGFLYGRPMAQQEFVVWLDQQLPKPPTHLGPAK
jgi:diguanylate cyclase (GGDEF)-like protein/PAS domain S-box-containing protein